MIKKVIMPYSGDKKSLFRIIDNCKNIQLACLKNGYWADLLDCYDLWNKVSDDYSAGWLIVPDDLDGIWEYVKSYVTGSGHDPVYDILPENGV